MTPSTLFIVLLILGIVLLLVGIKFKGKGKFVFLVCGALLVLFSAYGLAVYFI